MTATLYLMTARKLKYRNSEQVRHDHPVIKIKNFRNYELLNLTFHPVTNIFHGDNAQGKTNILEAVYLAGTTKSHRGTKDRDMISFGEEESHIEVKVLKNGVPFRIDIHLKKNSPKGLLSTGCLLNGQASFSGLSIWFFFTGRSEYYQERSSTEEAVHGSGALPA